MIQIAGLSRHYGPFKAVDDVSFTIRRGEIVGLLGHNGAGKTTIMKMVTGFLEPTAGVIKVDDLRIGPDTRAIQQRIGYLPENCPLWPEMTVLEYLEYQAGLHNIAPEQVQKAVARAIRRTALKEKATLTIGTLSRGYRQRVGVAQAILHDPDIIILDEPTNGLDPTQINQMRGLIRELAGAATVILSTHILQEVQAVCDRVLIMRNGRMVLDARLDELQTDRRLRLVVNNGQADDYLKEISEIQEINTCTPVDGHPCFELTGPAEIAPRIAAAVHKAGDQLYTLQPVSRTLETVFAEVNSVTGTEQEVAHA
ncbi:ABC transporter ATP-binding protein [Desulfolithobacter sp.]